MKKWVWKRFVCGRFSFTVVFEMEPHWRVGFEAGKMHFEMWLGRWCLTLLIGCKPQVDPATRFAIEEAKKRYGLTKGQASKLTTGYSVETILGEEGSSEITLQIRERSTKLIVWKATDDFRLVCQAVEAQLAIIAESLEA